MPPTSKQVAARARAAQVTLASHHRSKPGRPTASFVPTNAAAARTQTHGLAPRRRTRHVDDDRDADEREVQRALEGPREEIDRRMVLPALHELAVEQRKVVPSKQPEEGRRHRASENEVPQLFDQR